MSCTIVNGAAEMYENTETCEVIGHIRKIQMPGKQVVEAIEAPQVDLFRPHGLLDEFWSSILFFAIFVFQEIRHLLHPNFDSPFDACSFSSCSVLHIGNNVG